MNLIVETAKTTLVNTFLTATMTRKIFIWYFIEYLLDRKHIPASVQWALQDVRHQVAKTISTNLITMISQQGRDIYRDNKNNNLVSYLANSVMELSSMGSIVLVMSFVTDDMLDAAHSGLLSTNELKDEVFAGLMIYSTHIDTINDTSLDRLSHNIGGIQSSDFFPGLGVEISGSENNDTRTYTGAQVDASSHMGNVCTRLQSMIRILKNARDYIPSNNNTRVHTYTVGWTADDYHVPIGVHSFVTTFYSERDVQLDLLSELANKIAKVLMMVGVQQKFPNEVGHTFMYGTGNTDTVANENNIYTETDVCIKMAKKLSAYQGIALSFVRVLLVASHQSHIKSRIEDWPNKVLARKSADEDHDRIKIKFNRAQQDLKEAYDARINGEIILNQLTNHIDLLFLCWNVDTNDTPLTMPSDNYTNSTLINGHITTALLPLLASLDVYALPDDTARTPFDRMLNALVPSVLGVDSKWSSCMYPINKSVANVLVQTEEELGVAYKHPLVTVYRYYYQELLNAMDSDDDESAKLYAIQYLHEKLVGQIDGHWDTVENWSRATVDIYRKILEEVRVATFKFEQALKIQDAAQDKLEQANHIRDVRRDSLKNAETLLAVQVVEEFASASILTVLKGTSGISMPLAQLEIIIRNLSTPFSKLLLGDDFQVVYDAVRQTDAESFARIGYISDRLETKNTAVLVFPAVREELILPYRSNLNIQRDPNTVNIKYGNPTGTDLIAIIRAYEVGVPGDGERGISYPAGGLANPHYRAYMYLHGYEFTNVANGYIPTAPVNTVVSWMNLADLKLLYDVHIARTFDVVDPIFGDNPYLDDSTGKSVLISLVDLTGTGDTVHVPDVYLPYLTLSAAYDALALKESDANLSVRTLKQELVIKQVSLSCSLTVSTLFGTTVPEVRKKLLAQIQNHVTLTIRTETASKMVQKTASADYIIVQDQLAKAVARYIDADTYIVSQTIAPVGEKGLVSIGKGFGQSCKFNKQVFIETYVTLQ
jgi:hypothetical protein